MKFEHALDKESKIITKVTERNLFFVKNDYIAVYGSVFYIFLSGTIQSRH